MNSNNLWNKAKKVHIQTTTDIIGNFNLGFDNKIPEEVKAELCNFVSWVEKNFHLPVTLWVDFEYKHYLVRRDGKRVGFLFYWADFSSYPLFNDSKDIPMLRLSVRTEYSSIDEILISFIEGISYYFAWICNVLDTNYTPDEDEVEEIFQEYMKSKL